MLIKHAARIRSSEITPEPAGPTRRALIAGAGAAAVVAQGVQATEAGGAPLETVPSPYSTDVPPTELRHITNYNNFYEFGFDKSDPARHAHQLTTKPWSVVVDGLVANPATYQLEDFMAPHQLEERIYRFRCVEAWSRVVPWVGFELNKVLARAEPTSAARYVAFETLYRPEEMPGQRGSFQLLDWPYREGLRLDEAMHPLTILAVGLYGRELPNQNGAPLRLVVPWKYGFKSIKSVVRITLTDRQPPTSWNLQAPSEYGFYSNVNPEVAHPRWSQARERIVGGGLFSARRETEMFNGYAEEVASLYDGMDLREDF